MTCAVCSHSSIEQTEEKKEQRVCRRFPPQVQVIQIPRQGIGGVQMQVTFMGVFPPVPDSAICGEFATSSH
jgi:hypothetical protein